MLIVKKLYLMICRKVGPRGLTYSAWAWKHAMETGDHSTRIRIDGIWMTLFKVQGHCQGCWQMESRRMAVDKTSES